MVSYTEKFDIWQPFAMYNLALSEDLEARLRDVLDTDRGQHVIAPAVNEAMTALILREHGVTDDGDWSAAADVVRDILTQHAITADITPDGVWINALDRPVTGPVPGYDEDTEDADDNRPAIIAALAALGWQPIPDQEWVDIAGGLGTEAGATRVPVRPIPAVSDTVKVRLTILIDSSGDYDTELTVDEWNALTAEQRSDIAHQMWETAAQMDSGGVEVLTEGAEGL